MSLHCRRGNESKAKQKQRQLSAGGVQRCPGCWAGACAEHVFMIVAGC